MSIFAQNYRTELEIYMNQQYPSVLLEKAVGEFSKLPGIGRKTAMRLVLHLLRQDNATVEAFGNSIITLKHEVKYCRVCHNISDTDTCQICANPARAPVAYRPNPSAPGKANCWACRDTDTTFISRNNDNRSNLFFIVLLI